MLKVGAIVRRGEVYGVVIADGNSTFDAIKVEWADRTTEWVAVAEVEWDDSSK